MGIVMVDDLVVRIFYFCDASRLLEPDGSHDQPTNIDGGSASVR